MPDHITSTYECEAGHLIDILNDGKAPAQCPRYKRGSPCAKPLTKIWPKAKASAAATE